MAASLAITPAVNAAAGPPYLCSPAPNAGLSAVQPLQRQLQLAASRVVVQAADARSAASRGANSLVIASSTSGDIGSSAIAATRCLTATVT